MRKKLSTSVYTFRDIIKENCMYVDKTEDYFKLLEYPKGQFFLSRPRRFGKSMTLSALKSIFEGDKELFKGLYIYDQEYDWKTYPVIHISMNKIKFDSIDELDLKLSKILIRISEEYEIKLNESDASFNLETLIYKLSKKYTNVVILIDEYDKPILDNVDNLEECKKIRKFLKGFYGQVKACEEYIRFTFITGVSKFTQVSVFSDLNSLTDITMNRKFATICGFTQEECEHYFAEWITENAKELEMTQSAYLAKLKDKYNGIRFTEKETSLYNPVSWTSAMMNCDFKNYWFETGTPAFLFNLLKSKKYDLKKINNLNNLKIDSHAFSQYDIETLGIIPLLYQTGYLTIKDYEPASQIYTLSYPNNEVESAFLNQLSYNYTNAEQDEVSIIYTGLINSINENNIGLLIENLNIYYANLPYDLVADNEQSYHLVFALIFKNLSFKLGLEVKTNKGRMDAVIENDKYIYIFEFKYNKSAEIAINQIKEKEYYQKYLLDEKQLILVGINFNGDEKQIDDWKIEELKFVSSS